MESNKLHRLTLSENSIQLAEDGSVPQKVQLMRTGKFYDPYFGEMSIELFHLEQMVRNFEGKVRGVDLAIDYAHNSHLEAAGWIKKVFVEGDALMLQVDWTPKGEQCLKDKEYRYLSADFYFDYVDNETEVHYGPTLNGGGLTNRPFIKKMAPVVELSETKGEYVTELEQLKKQVETLTAETKTLGEKVTALTTENAALKKEKEDAKVLAEKTASFNKLLSEGKACEAQREAFIAGDMAKFAELHKPVNLSAKGHGKSGEGDGGEGKKSAVDEVTARAKTLLSEKKATNMRQAISAVLSEDKALAARYHEETWEQDGVEVEGDEE